MVDPNHLETPSASRSHVLAALVAASILATTATGCGVVSQSKVDECHRVTQNLRAENSRLKDISLDLRSRNQDLSQRAVDDAKRLSAQEEIVTSLENNVQAYQAEREKLAEAFDSLKRQVRLSVNVESTQTSRALKLETFAKSHDGWIFDAGTKSLSAKADILFEDGRDRLTATALVSLKDLAKVIADTGADTSTVEVTTLEKAPSPVQKASFDTGGEPRLDARATARFLATSQAARVREQLVGQGGLSPGLVKILPPSYPVDLSTAESDLPQHRMIAIRLSPSEKEPLKQADTPSPAKEDTRSGP